MHQTSIFAVIIYIFSLLIIGIIASKKTNTSKNYILGNRSLSYWVTAISANASDMSVWLFMGLPMAIYQSDLISAWLAVGLIAFMFINWQIIAKPLRKQSEELGCITLSSFIEKKINSHKKGIRLLLSLSSVFFLTIYISAGIIGLGYLFEQLFALNYYAGCIISIIAILIYISIGGFNAICYIDFVQGLFLLGVIILVPSLIIYDYLFVNKLTIKTAQKIDLLGFVPKNFTEVAMALSLVFGWGLGYFGQPHILNKFMAIKNSEEIHKAKLVGTIWQIIALFFAILVGISGHLFFKTPPTNPEMIFVLMTKSIFTPFIASFALCGILAATISTIDSQVIVAASSISQDVIKIFKKNPTEKFLLYTTRFSVIIICLISLSIALFKISSIHQAVYYCWSGLGCSFGPLLIACLYFKKLDYNYCFVSLIVSISIAVFGSYLFPNIPSLIIGFTFGFVIILLGNKNIKTENQCNDVK